MTITQIRLRRFKRFKDWSTTFAQGLTVVRGPNEAGKTTVMEAVFEGLFGSPARGEASARMRSWGEQRLGEITVEMQVKGSRYLLRKDLEAGTVLLQSEDGRERAETLRDVQKRLLEWTGLASEAAYRATAFVAQGDIARVSEDRRLLGAHLSRILSGAGVESVQQSLQWLADQRGRLSATLTGTKGGADRVAELRAQQTSQRQREERAQRHRVELREVVRRLEEIERDAAGKNELVRVARWAADLHRREQALIEEEAATKEYLSRAEGLLARLAKLDGELVEFSSQQEALIAELFHARRQHLQLESNLAAARDQTAKEERNLEHLATRHANAMSLGGMGWTLAGSGAIMLAGGGLIAWRLQHWIGWVLLALGAIAVVFGLRLRARIGEAGSDYRQQEQRVLDLRRRTEVMERQLGEAHEMVASRLRAVGGTSLEDVEGRFSAYMDLLREREEVRASLRQVRGPDPKAALEGRLREIAEELSSIRATIETVPKGVRRSPPSGVDQVEQQSKQLSGAEVQELRAKRARLEGVLDELRERGDEGARLEEEITSVQARSARSRQTLEILDQTARMLEEARTQSVFPARELLERRAGEYLSQATDGAYSRLALDERALRPQVWVPAAGTWKDASELSQGTSDQLYLCLRLALLDVLTADRKPPLFLDEPLAHLDEERRRAMLHVLGAAAKDRQVVLFTCWPDYDQVAERVIVLERAGAA